MTVFSIGLKTGADIDTDVLALTSKVIEEMSLDTTMNRKLISNKSLSLLKYLDAHTTLVEKDVKLRQALNNSCWVVPRASPPKSTLTYRLLCLYGKSK